MKNKILLALNGFFPNNSAGTEIYVLELAKFLRKHDYDVSIIIPNTGELSNKYEYDGFDVYQYPVPNSAICLKANTGQNKKYLDFFYKKLFLIKPDIIHFHSFNRAMHSEHLKLAKQMRIKTCLTAHVGGIFCARGDLYFKSKKLCDGKIRFHRCMSCYLQYKYNLSYSSDILAILINFSNILFPWIKHYKASFNIIKHKSRELRMLNKYCDEIISISKWMVNTYALNGVKKTFAASQQVSNIHTLKKTYPNIGDKLNLIFVGRVYPIKNIELLLNAIAEIGKDKFDLTMVVIKDKSSINYYDNIKKIYKKLRFNKWYEDLPNTSVPDFLKKSDMLCLPSISEVAPMVIKEAFDCGVPVLGAKIPAIKEMVTHGTNGLLFETNSKSSLKEQLNRLINQDGLLYQLKAGVSPMQDISEVYKKIELKYRCLILGR